MTISRVSFAAALGLSLGAAACEDGELLRPTVPSYAGAERFSRYVSIGNSLTAGVQSGGIHEQLQAAAYPVLVARQMGTIFHIPRLTFPGCPVPYDTIFTQHRLLGLPDGFCAFRTPGEPPPFLNNVAVPSAEVFDVLQNGPAPGTNSNALTLLFLGGRTQLEAMTDAGPTFVSVWIGNNDLLGAATASDTNLITPQAAFEQNYRQMLDGIEATGAEALLIGVGLGHIGQTMLPFWSRGSTYYGLFISGAFAPAPFTVTVNCAPPRGDTVFVPFPFGLGLINTAKTGTPTTLDCSEPPVLEPPEVVKLAGSQAGYNAFIASEAADRGWAYMNLNDAFDSLAAVPGQVAPFPAATTAGGEPNPCSASPFGLAFSCDGIHISSAAHALVAKKAIQAINAEYGSAIPPIP